MSYVVTTSIRGIARTQIWEGTTPLSVGHPMQWVIEKTENGVRARKLGTQLNQTHTGGLREITHTEIQRGAEIELPSQEKLNNRCIIRIKPVQKTAPAYQSHSGNTLTVFSCLGNTIISSALARGEYKGQYKGAATKEDAFILTSSGGNNYTLRLLRDEITVVREGKTLTQQSEPFHLSAQDLAAIHLAVGNQRWYFGLLTAPAAADIINTNKRAMDPETKWFFHSLKYAAVGFAAFLILAWIWPKPKPSEELIPPQIAKIVLANPTSGKIDNQDAGGGKATAAQKIEKAAVVQAFRAKALQSSISGLLKGGMTRLMTQSNFLAGTAGTAEARKMFDTKSTALMATAPATGLMNAKAVNVASIGGGSGGGAGGGNGVGYGAGQRAGIQGQGNAMISLDLGNSDVAEGLSKDEVGEVIHKHLAEVRYCYESAILRTPGIEGRLIINFTIGKIGNVTTSEVKSSTLPDPRLDDCIIRRLTTWKFPQPKGGVDVAVSYPFIFKTLGR